MTFVQKRIRNMMGRILASMEHTLGESFSDITPEHRFTLDGDGILFIRNVILDACNDTIRSLPSNTSTSDVVIPQQGIKPLRFTEFDILDSDDGDSAPMCRLWGPADFIHVLRDQIGRGIVYNADGKTYYCCIGLKDNVDFVIPFMDKVRLMSINVGGGEYAEWRDSVVKMYIGDITND